MPANVRIELSGLLVDDQERALRFYTEKLGFEVKTDIPTDEQRFLTLSSPAGVDGVELVLMPNSHPAAAAYQKTMHDEGIAATAFFVLDLEAEYERLRKSGVEFRQPPTNTVHGWQAIFDDSVGNLITLQER